MYTYMYSLIRNFAPITPLKPSGEVNLQSCLYLFCTVNKHYLPLLLVGSCTPKRVYDFLWVLHPDSPDIVGTYIYCRSIQKHHFTVCTGVCRSASAASQRFLSLSAHQHIFTVTLTTQHREISRSNSPHRVNVNLAIINPKLPTSKSNVSLSVSF